MTFRKNFLLIALATMFAILLLTPASLQASQVHVTIDGRQINFADQGPTIVDSRTLVPVRGVFEELGFEVDWEETTHTARLTSSGHEVALTIGYASFITNGESHTLDVPAQIIGSRTMLPIRAVLESVGYIVDWNQATSTVRISSSVAQLLREMTDDARLRTAEAYHRILVSAAILYMADNNGAMPPNAEALDYYMWETFAELNGPSGPSSALPAGAQYSFTSGIDAQGRATITITTVFNGQLVATWSSQ